jgi:hypothetical protein
MRKCGRCDGGGRGYGRGRRREARAIEREERVDEECEERQGRKGEAL